MAQSMPAAKIDANLQGDISGQVAIGNNNVQFGSLSGCEVNITLPGQQPRVQPRPTPVLVRPRPFANLLDRQAEIKATNAAFQTHSAIEFFGEEGLGKTAILRHIANSASLPNMSDGIVYLSAAHQTLADIGQFLWDAFYARDQSFKPTDAQIRSDLQNKHALILVDDTQLSRDDAQALMNLAPNCAFCLAGQPRHLWGEGTALALSGLPAPDALVLLERELGRALTPQERPAAHALCTALNGHPLHLLRAAALARENRHSLIEMASKIRDASHIKVLNAWTMNSLSPLEQRLVAVLATFEGVPVHADHLAAIVGIADAAPALRSLQQRAMAEAHSPQYILTGTLSEDLQHVWDLTPWAERALTHFVQWAESFRRDPQRILEAISESTRALEWAIRLKRGREAIRLGRAIEGALALSGRWGAWAHVLQLILQAAQMITARNIEGWALHQLGSRALCLESKAEASSLLQHALQLREAIGDVKGAAVTRHNLNLLMGPPPSPGQSSQTPSKPKPSARAAARVPAIVKTLMVVTIIIVIGVIVWWNRDMIFPPPPEPTVPIPVPSSPTPTEPAMPTPTSWMPTSAPTPTPRPAWTAAPTWTPVPTPMPTWTPSPTAPPPPAPTATWWPAPTTIPTDLTGPDISNITLAALESVGSPTVCPYKLQVTAQVSDASDVGTVELWYRTTAPTAGDWVHEPMTTSDARTYSLDQWRVKDALSYPPKSYEFYVYAEDTRGNHRTTDTYTYRAGTSPDYTCYAWFIAPNMNYYGNNYLTTYPTANDPDLCLQDCRSDSNCRGVTYLKIGTMPPSCWLKETLPTLIPDTNAVSGEKIWP